MASVPGLMGSTALSAPGGGAPAPAPPDDPESDEGAPASPQEEAQMEQFLAQCKLAIYDPKHPEATKAIIQALKTGDPVPALAHAALSVVNRVEAAATQSGDKLDPSVLLQGGYEVVSDIAQFSNQVSKAQGTPTYNDRQIQAAYLQAVDLYRTMKQKSGTLDKAPAEQEFAALKQADQAGNLGSVLPGANKIASGEGSDEEEQGEAPDDEAAEDAAPAPAPAPAKPVPGLSKKKKKRRR